MLATSQDYTKLSRYRSIRKVLLLLYWRGRGQGQKGVITCPETYSQSCLSPQHIFSADTICFSASFLGPLPLLLPLLSEFPETFSRAGFSALRLLSLGNLTHFFVLHLPRGNTFTWLPSARAPLLSSRSFLQLPMGQQHTMLQAWHVTSSSKPILPLRLPISVKSHDHPPTAQLRKHSVVLPTSHLSSATFQGPLRLGSCLSFQLHFFSFSPWHPSPSYDHPIAIPGMSQAHLLSLFFLSLGLLPIVPLTVTYSSPCS